jgi:cytoskeletal protein RodZ
MIEPDKDRPEENKGFSYTAHNYEAMNKAIETEVEKRYEISSLYHYQSSSRRTLMLLHTTLSLCVLTLTAAIIFWLFHQSNIELKNPWPTTTVDQALREQQTHSALNTLSSQEKGEPTEQAFINTSFTVFHRTLIPSGEYVVTGKTFQPDQLSKPSEQYCYLEQNQSSEAVSGLPLAVVENNQLILETKVPELINYAKRYCQFSR